MNNFEKDIRKNVINQLDNASSVVVSTAVTSIGHSIKSRFVNDDLDLFLVISRESITAAHLNFNHLVNVCICDDETDSGSVSLSGEISKINDDEEIHRILEKWNGKYPDHPISGELNDKLVVKVLPRRIDIQHDEREDSLVLSVENELIRRFVSTILLKLKLISAILRVPFFTASIAPVILGASIAFHQRGMLNWWTFLLTLIGSITAHAAANVINDYYDHCSGNDEMNIYHNAFSGGSRMIQNKIITPEKTYFIAVFLFVITILIGLYLNSVTNGNIILYIGIIGVILGFTYSASPLKLSYRGIGEMAIVVSFGPLIVVGAYYVQVQSLDLMPLLASIPNGILVGLILLINEFQDMTADQAAGKNTIVVQLKKKKRSLLIYKISLSSVFIWLLGCTIAGIFPLWTLITLIAIPMIKKAFCIASAHYEKIWELLPANALTIGIHLMTTLLFALAFILDVFI